MRKTSRRLFRWCYSFGEDFVYKQGADVALTVKTNQPTLRRQISRQFEGKRQIPFTATAEEKRHRRETRWELRAKEAPDHIKESWPGSAWIVELITTKTTRKGTSSVRHLFITSIRTTPEALLRLIRQRWSNCFAEAWRLRKRMALGPRHPAR